MGFTPRQNRADNQSAAWVPQMPGYSDWRDKAFEDMRTEQQQIWWLYAHLASNSDTTSSNTESLDDITARLAAAEESLAGIQATLDGLLAKFQALAENSIDYDVTQGTYTTTQAAQRRMWQGQMYYGMSVEDLSAFTVEEAGTMNCLRVAVRGRIDYMTPDGEAPERRADAIQEQNGWRDPDFEPDAYIKKSELVLVDTDNLEDNTIMGVLTKDAATRKPQSARLMRRGTTTDLANLWILANDHMVTYEKE